jgi:hypothetical protein
MEQEKYDPYYRDFPSTVLPARTPFTRPGQYDAGHVFVYLTNTRKRWSLLLDQARKDSIYNEARQRIPRGLSQFWLLEKRYSTHKPRARALRDRPRSNIPPDHTAPPARPDHSTWPGKLLVVLREPYQYYTQQSDVISYHFEEAKAIAAAETYTRRRNRRAIVGLLLWDEVWF